jgi:patatin-related protein
VFVPMRGEDSDELHPDMSGIANVGRGRWVVDGGVLLNTPLRLVLDDIGAAPADVQVRRLLLFVVPDPWQPDTDGSSVDARDKPPTLRETLAAVAVAPFQQTVADDLTAWRAHNVQAVARRDARTDMLEALHLERLPRLATDLFDAYLAIRRRRAVDFVAQRATAQSPETMARELLTLISPPNVVDGTTLPNAPDDADPDADWRWGLATLERLADTVLDLLKRVIWVLPTAAQPIAGQPTTRDDVVCLRAMAHDARQALAAARLQDEDYWRRRRGQSVEQLAAAAQEWNPVLAELVGWQPGQLWRPNTVAERPRRDGVVAPASSVRSAGAQVALELIDIGAQAARLVGPYLPGAEQTQLGGRRLNLLQEVFAGVDLTTRDGQRDALHRLLALEVCSVCLLEGPPSGGPEDVVELVQVSASVKHPYTQQQAQQRVAGLRLGHFAAFLKQSWRVNDWLWGRLDGSNRLITALLDPQRLHRLVVLDPRGREVAIAVMVQALGLDPASSAAAALTAAMRGTVAPEREHLRPVIDHLVEEHARAVVLDLEDELERAVRHDRAEGGNPTSRGERWLAAKRGEPGPDRGLLDGVGTRQHDAEPPTVVAPAPARRQPGGVA